MAWCPICKSEYREGFTECSECKVPLVDKLKETEQVLLCTFSDKEISDKFTAYLKFSKINFSVEEQDEFISILVDKKKLHDGIVAVNAFVNVEEDLFSQKNIDSSYYIGSKTELLNELKEEYKDDILDSSADFRQEDGEAADDAADNEAEPLSEEEIMALNAFSPRDSVIYESKAAKADESYGSGIMLIAIGCIGIAAKIFFLKGSPGFSDIVMFAVFAAMILFGIYSIASSKKYRREAEEETAFTDSVRKWLENNITKADLVAQDIPGDSPEANYFRRTEYIKTRIDGEFPDLEENFADSLVEDFYDTVFEK